MREERKTEAEAFYKRFLASFKAYAVKNTDVRGAYMVGSRARTKKKADQWSDMDLMLYLENSEKYKKDGSFVNNFEKTLLSCSSVTAGDDFEWLVLYEGGYQVDFVIHSAEDLRYMKEHSIIPLNFYRGVKVIADKEDAASTIVPVSFSAPEKAEVTEEEYLSNFRLFWFLAVYTIKQLHRGELWVAKERDHDMKQLLLQMMEWSEKAVMGQGYDTWHAGRFLSNWVSEDTENDLKNAFGHFNIEDSKRALLTTIELYRRLAEMVARKKGFTYPEEMDIKMQECFQMLLRNEDN